MTLVLTFNPGWDADVKEVNPLRDIRVLQEEGIELLSKADLRTVGPASFIFEDSNGNPILVDQHR